MTCIFPGVI